MKSIDYSEYGRPESRFGRNSANQSIDNVSSTEKMKTYDNIRRKQSKSRKSVDFNENYGGNEALKNSTKQVLQYIQPKTVIIMGDSRKEQKKRIQYPQKVYKNSKVKIVNQVYINNFLNSDCVESTR